jgi:NAD(P)-dependent dehydrogenase (short-subunit alcohol dehydrogenase family)
MGLANRTALVTGAAHGIGAGIAKELLRQGAHVIVLDLDGQALTSTFADEPDATQRTVDLAKDDTAQLAEELCREIGPIELIVNNVGIDTPHGFLELSEPDFDLVFATNLRGPWFLTRALVLDLIERSLGGAIVFVSSLHDHRIRGRPHYSASKAAVAMLVKELAQELAPHRIRVNAVSPGIVRSHTVPLTQPVEAARAKRFVPMGGAGEPADVARVTAALLDEEISRYVTGANVPVDGGLGLHSWSVDP